VSAIGTHRPAGSRQAAGRHHGHRDSHCCGTDAEAATFLDTDVDPRDHPFILGVADDSVPALNDAIREAISKGASLEDVDALTQKWNESVAVMTFWEAVEQAIDPKREDVLKTWRTKSEKMSLWEAGRLASELGVDVSWSSNKPRTREGYYRINGGLQFGIARGQAFAPYADLVWMETKSPSIGEAKAFAEGVKGLYPKQMLSYNNSPSFNWDASGMSDKDMQDYIWNLGKMGYVWQFITLAGFHSDALITDIFAKDYAKRGMLAYVEKIQRQEREHGVETLTHQKWSGAELMDTQLKIATGGTASTLAMGAGVTEDQFGAKH